MVPFGRSRRLPHYPRTRLLLCLGVAAAPLAGQAPGPAPALARLERAWLELRTLQDQLRLTQHLGATVSPRGVPLDSLLAHLALKHSQVRALLALVPAVGLSGPDARALGFLTTELARMDRGATTPAAGPAASAECDAASAERLLRARLDSLTARTFLCYGAAARRIVVEGDTLDRLAILGLLGRTDSAARRRRLFLALEPVWRSVNGDDSAASPYRALLRLRRGAPTPGGVSLEEAAERVGVPPDSVERWLVQVLEAWRATVPDRLVEPWDWYYQNGAASRLLSPRIPRDSLQPLVNRFYRSLGAAPERLGVHYDLVPRPGKYPISFTDFGARQPVEPWIFTSYRIGGLDNLGELLHEVGHAVHIAAIRTRPAYLDWPDSDIFTEAIADLAALELSEPAWQRRFLGVSAPPASSLRAKYAGIMLDVAWALFEIRARQYPERSPNQIWTQLTSEYLRIRPHPEWSWWAMRGQLVEAPGYLLNYALGAILIADLRKRLVTLHGRFTTGDPGWYAWVAPRLYRFGAERPARELVLGFLGRPVAVAALLADLRRNRAER